MEGRMIVMCLLIAGIIVAGLLVLVAGEGSRLIAGAGFDGRWGTGRMMDPDRMFIEQMIPHHQNAIDMAELALSRAEHPELRQLAQNIIQDQSREIELMRSWYLAWYGTEVPVYPDVLGDGHGMMHGRAGAGTTGSGMMGAGTDLAALAGATQFDKEFIEQMVPHHEMAIIMVQMVRNSDRAELRDLGKSIITTQSAEVEQMRGWYSTWYGTEIGGSPVSGMKMGLWRGPGQ